MIPEDGFDYVIRTKPDPEIGGGLTRFVIGKLPYRKRWMLYIEKPGLIHSVASFTSPEAAGLFLDEWGVKE